MRVEGFAYPDLLIEVEAIAYVPAASARTMTCHPLLDRPSSMTTLDGDLPSSPSPGATEADVEPGCQNAGSGA